VDVKKLAKLLYLDEVPQAHVPDVVLLKLGLDGVFVQHNLGLC